MFVSLLPRKQRRFAPPRGGLLKVFIGSLSGEHERFHH